MVANEDGFFDRNMEDLQTLMLGGTKFLVVVNLVKAASALVRRIKKEPHDIVRSACGVCSFARACVCVS